jgi:hypothetical protein
MMFKSQWCRRLGDLQVLVHPRLLLRTAMVVAVAGDVTLDLWAPLLEAQGTDPLPKVSRLVSGDVRARDVKAAARESRSLTARCAPGTQRQRS